MANMPAPNTPSFAAPTRNQLSSTGRDQRAESRRSAPSADDEWTALASDASAHCATADHAPTSQALGLDDESSIGSYSKPRASAARGRENREIVQGARQISSKGLITLGTFSQGAWGVLDRLLQR